MKTIQSTVAFQDPQGNAVASGVLILTLSQPAEIISGGGQVVPLEVRITLGADGKIPAATQIWANDELTPSMSYTAAIRDSGNNFIASFGPWSISGPSPIDLSAMTPTTTGASYPSPVLLSPSGDQTITSGDLTLESGSLSAGQIDNRIYVDGVKYTLDHTGIAAAIADACAMSGNPQGGTVVYFPPMNLTGASAVATGFTITNPIRIVGAGMGSTALECTTGPLFTIKPAANFSHSQVWEIAHGNWTADSGDVIKIDDSNGFQTTAVRIHDNVINPASTTGNAVVYASTIQDGGFDWRITDNFMFGGIHITTDDASTHGLADGLLIANNTWSDSTGNTTVAMHLDSISGAAQWTVFHNRGGLGGGILETNGTQQLNIICNQFESTSGTGTANAAMVDLVGSATLSVVGCNIIGNNFNAHTNATNVIRIDRASNVVIDRNTITEKSTGVGILTTANANPVFSGNNYFGGGGTNFSGSGTFQYNFATTSFNIGNISPGQRLVYNNSSTLFEYEFLNSGSGIAGLQVGGMDWFEGSGPGTSASGHARMWADSTSHTFKVNNNAGSSFSLTETIASGTATMTTAAIAAGAAGSTVTVAATGVATTDAIQFSFNAAIGANPGVLIVHSWVTSGNVNFAYFNPTAGSVTPSAATLNWRVVR